MGKASERLGNGGRQFPLAAKLALSLLAVALLMLIFLLSYFGPRTSRSFSDRCDELVERSSEVMRELARESTANSKEVLVSVIRRSADARRRSLADLPLSLYEGNVERIRRAIELEDGTRSRRLLRNVDLLAGEMERRSLRRIGEHVDDLAKEQSELGAVFAGEVRRSYLLLCGVAVAILLLVLGGGLYRVVVRPVRSLRRATHDVIRGDLTVGVDVASTDEVGALSRDFATMVRQLRDSRAELTELNRNLETEVARKTEHLESALTDLRRTQRKLVHAEKMASVGTLAGGVAHEFNNLIGGIRGCVTEALADEEDPERREPLEVVLRATTRGADITDQLLRFAKLRVDQLRAVEVSAVLSEALQLVEPDARRLGVRIVPAFSQGLTVFADSQAIYRVFLNLFRNALQAMSSGGELNVTAEIRDDQLTVGVRDTGDGISEDSIEQVFDPFFTTRGKAKDPFLRGSGLGLSVSYGIVEAHGGTIEVESVLGQGSTFTVRLPRNVEGSP